MINLLINRSLLVKRKVSIAPEWQKHPGSAFYADIELKVRSSEAEILKDDEASTVAAVPYNGSRLVIKQYNFKSLFKFLSRSIRCSYAQKTWDNARFLSQIGIETVKPLCLIEDRLAFFKIRSFFVGTFIPGQDAQIFFNDKSKTADEHRIASERIVASLCELHSRGVFIGDTKDKNVVVSPSNVFWVDLEELSYPRWKWLQLRKAQRDWRVLFFSWKNHNTAQQLFHKASKEKLGLREYWKYARIAAVYRKKKFSIKEFKSTKTLSSMTSDSLLAQVKDIAQGVIPSDWERVDCSSKAIVARKSTAEGSLYCKVFLRRNRLEGLKELFRLGRGARSVRNEQMMQTAGFLVPETLYWGKIEKKEYTISRGVNGTTILLWFKQRAFAPRIKRKILRGLGEEVAALHIVGFVHGDLRMGNIMVEENCGHFRFYFIDNERTRLYRKIPRRLIIQNLRQINTDAISILSKADRLRVLRAYQKIHGRFNRNEERRLITKIDRQTRKRLSR